MRSNIRIEAASHQDEAVLGRCWSGAAKSRHVWQNRMHAHRVFAKGQVDGLDKWSSRGAIAGGACQGDWPSHQGSARSIVDLRGGG